MNVDRLCVEAGSGDRPEVWARQTGATLSVDGAPYRHMEIDFGKAQLVRWAAELMGQVLDAGLLDACDYREDSAALVSLAAKIDGHVQAWARDLEGAADEADARVVRDVA